MKNRSSLVITAAAVGLMSASIVGLAKLPAISSVHPNSVKTCNSGSACLSYKNNGSGDAIDGASTSSTGNGVYGTSHGSGSTGVLARNFSGGWGVYGQTSGPVGQGAGVAAISGNHNVALTASVNTSNLQYPVIQGFNSSGKIAELDDVGNWGIAGLLYTSGDCSQGCSRKRHVKMYAPRVSSPTAEDVGESRLVAGRASVALDPSFANVIDRKSGYVVLITPEGENRGLYVLQRGPSSFEVREAQGGKSTLDFAYRIVAHPYGVAATRLPMIDDGAAKAPILQP